ncbi:MAG: hypothetical protein DBY09_06035, partial [Selenomonadales bacterium]
PAGGRRIPASSLAGGWADRAGLRESKQSLLWPGPTARPGGLRPPHAALPCPPTPALKGRAWGAPPPLPFNLNI